MALRFNVQLVIVGKAGYQVKPCDICETIEDATTMVEITFQSDHGGWGATLCVPHYTELRPKLIGTFAPAKDLPLHKVL